MRLATLVSQAPEDLIASCCREVAVALTSTTTQRIKLPGPGLAKSHSDGLPRRTSEINTPARHHGVRQRHRRK